MYQERSRLELYLELLTQVKNGNCKEATLMQCTNLSLGALRLALGPLLFESLLKKVKVSEGKGGRFVYHLTEKGDRFIEFLVLGINYAEDINEVNSRWIGSA